MIIAKIQLMMLVGEEQTSDKITQLFFVIKTKTIFTKIIV